MIWLAAGTSAVSVLTGACAELTAIPPAVMSITGALLFAIATRVTARDRSRVMSGIWLAMGAFTGALLPTSPPPVAGDVNTRAIGNRMRGDLFDVLNALDADPSKVLGRRVSVSGEWSPPTDGRDATISRRIMTCCAADAIAVGFDVELARPRAISARAWIRIDGVVAEHLRNGELRYVLERSTESALEDLVNKQR